MNANPSSPGSSPGRLPRRTVLQWFAAATAASASGGIPLPNLASGKSPAPAAEGYGTDPDLVKVYEPGDAWPLTFSESERALVAALVDTILPADEYGPAGSELRVPDYLDEWISAPYLNQQRDREIVVPGLARFAEHVEKAFSASFVDLDPEKRVEACASVAPSGERGKGDGPLAGFFHRFTMIAAGAYYANPTGWKAIGYAGNLASGVFAGPPQEVLDRVGVEQTVAD